MSTEPLAARGGLVSVLLGLPVVALCGLCQRRPVRLGCGAFATRIKLIGALVAQGTVA